jgi:predicted nucleotidyltransferase
LLTIKRNILAALAYFDMFDYPLTYSEIFLFLEDKYQQSEFNEAVHSLVFNKMIFQFDKYYSLKNDYGLIARRNKGNEKAAELIKKAKEVGRLLIKFPYVRGVGISGSLSKNFADNKSDIDLFIITKENRLWVARSFMHCFKKLTFLVNKQHHYCMNYYIDEEQLQIVEKNIYTAIEIGTLIPLEGDTVFERFYAANSWTRDLLPNKNLRLASAKPLRKYFLKSLVETLLNNRAGEWLDNMLMKFTAGRWNKKTQMKKLNMRGTVMGMAASKHCAKPDPVNFQTKLITRYQHKLVSLLQETENRVAQ